MYAPAKRAYLFRDSYSGLSRGYGVVEFDHVESSIHVLSFSSDITVRGIQVHIGYANPQCIREAHNSVPTYTTPMPPSLTSGLMPAITPSLFQPSYPMVMNPLVMPNLMDGIKLSDGRPFPSNYKTDMIK